LTWAGDRQLDRLSVLCQIAAVLDISLAVLIDTEEAERRRICPDDREVEAVRLALRRYDAITNVFRANGDELPEPNLTALEHAVRGATSQVSHQSTRTLPRERGPRIRLCLWHVAHQRKHRERRASHLLDVTRGHLQTGQRDAASVTLLEADQLAPEEVRCRDLTRQIITDLVRSYPRGITPMVGVTKLARAVGVAV
jgi:hypothetical protein